MKREWQPGDVALVVRPGAPALSGHPAMFTEDHGWCCRSIGPDCDGEPIRPLVVIDPEDREQLERLRRVLGADHYYGTLGLLAAALREFADPKPPKPEEPLGIGAVIEDAEGSIWVRVGRKPGNTWYRPHGEYARYSDIDVVRVLSDGWAGEDA